MRVLFGLKSSGATFRKHLGDCMRILGYTPCLADPDIWLKAEARGDGFEYYSYILNYVDDIMVIHEKPRPILDKIDKYMKLKPYSVGTPDTYVGAKLKKAQLESDVWCWTMSPSKYVQEAVKNTEKHINNNYDGKYSFTKNAPNPFPLGYETGMDTTPLLPPDEASYYSTIIGMLRWMV